MRYPTQEEQGYDEEAERMVSDCLFIIVDDYVSDCPSFAGKICLCVFGDINYYELLYYHQDKWNYSKAEQPEEKELCEDCGKEMFGQGKEQKDCCNCNELPLEEPED